MKRNDSVFVGFIVFQVFFSSSFGGPPPGNEFEYVTLYPDRPIENRVISFREDDVHTFLLSDLLPDTSYEVRISYPATIPTEFFISFSNDSIFNEEIHLNSRTLKNIEKLMFQVEKDGTISQRYKSPVGYFIEVKARFSGVSPPGESKKKEVPYGIVLETLLPPGIPYDSITIALIFSFTLIFVVTVILPQAFPFLHAVLKDKDKQGTKQS